MSNDFSDSGSASASASGSESATGADAVVDKALQGAQEGISSYTHGSRSVSRNSPLSGLDFADRYEERARRKSGRMPFMRCVQG